jgi:hypothetical protein
MRKSMVTAMAMAMAAALLPALAHAQQQLRPETQSARLAGGSAPMMGATKQPMVEVFTHPQTGFTVVAPPGAKIAENAQAKQVTVRSPKGFAVNVQAGPTRPDIPLDRMSGLLETRYMGDGKPWTARSTERAIKVGNLSAYEVNYTGTNSNARVVVVRGAENDYVFIFMAPHHQFVKLSNEFEWMLQQFKPSKNDEVAAVRAAAVTSQMKPKQVMPGQMKSDTPSAQSKRRFTAPGFGYEIEYPSDWEINKPAEMAAMFSGREGTPAYAAIVGVQNIQPIGATSGDEAAKRAFNQLTSSLGNAVRDLRILSDTPWTYQRDGRQLVGRQVTVSYVHAGHHFRKQLIVIPRPSGTVAHVWSYTAPEPQFSSFQPIASEMLASWRLLTADAR